MNSNQRILVIEEDWTSEEVKERNYERFKENAKQTFAEFLFSVKKWLLCEIESWLHLIFYNIKQIFFSWVDSH